MNLYDFTINQGETLSLNISVTGSSGSPINLSGSSISGFLKTKYGDSSPLLNLNATIINAISGILSLSVPATGTAILPTNISFYDIGMFNSGSSQTTKLVRGKVFVSPQLTS